MTLEQLVSIFGDNQFKLCNGKRAIDSQLHSKAEAEEWLAQGKNIGLWCPAGFVIIDIDDANMAERFAMMTSTLRCKTPHGMHFYFRTSLNIRQVVNGHLPVGLRCDTRVAGKGYCLLPYNCKDREWIDGEVEELPYWAVPLNVQSKSDSYVTVGMKEGQGRNDALIRQAMRLKSAGFSEENIAFTLGLINTYVFDEHLDGSEMKSIINNAKSYTGLSRDSKLDFRIYGGNGAVVSINHKAIVDYLIANHPMFTLGGSLYYYQNGVFEKNEIAVKDLIKSLIDEPKYQKQSQINEILKLLMDDLRIQFEDKWCNQYKNLINFKNGMFDVETQQLLPHDPKYLSTIQIPNNYVESDLDINDVQFMDFLRKTELPQDDLDMILDYIAYCMTVGNGMKCFMCLVGGGDTGKSTLIKMLNKLVGSRNISSLSIQDLSKRFYPSRLKDKLVNSCADNSSIALDDIGNLKKITGDDEIMYEDKGCTPYFFTSFAKLIFSFNTMPLQLEEKSDAFYNRMRILEMNHKLVLTQRYVDDLCSEESISGLIPLLCKRLKTMKRILPSANSKYLCDRLRSESDSIHAFLKEGGISVTNNYGDYIYQDDLYDAYSRFCMKDDRVPHKRINFYRCLETLGFVLATHEGKKLYVGVKKIS